MEDFCFDYFDPITFTELKIEVNNDELKFCMNQEHEVYMSRSEAKVLAEHILVWVEKE